MQSTNQNNSADRWALVTGASRGIGFCYASELAKMGYRLILVSNELKPEGFPEWDMDYVCMDLATSDAAEKLWQYTAQKGYEVEVLINNAGIFYFDSMTDVSSSTLETMLSLHVVTLTRLCRYFGKAMKQRGRGFILNMGSASDMLPYAGISTYAATKAYVRNMSIALNRELLLHGVHVMAVRPGAVATGLYGVTGKIQKLGLSLGIMMTPEKLAKRAIRKLFSSRTGCYVPRFITHGYIFFSHAPWWLLKIVETRIPMFNFLLKK